MLPVALGLCCVDEWLIDESRYRCSLLPSSTSFPNYFIVFWNSQIFQKIGVSSKGGLIIQWTARVVNWSSLFLENSLLIFKELPNSKTRRWRCTQSESKKEKKSRQEEEARKTSNKSMIDGGDTTEYFHFNHPSTDWFIHPFEISGQEAKSLLDWSYIYRLLYQITFLVFVVLHQTSNEHNKDTQRIKSILIHSFILDWDCAFHIYSSIRLLSKFIHT